MELCNQLKLAPQFPPPTKNSIRAKQTPIPFFRFLMNMYGQFGKLQAQQIYH